MGVPYLPKKTARDPPSWSCFDALFGWPNGECFTTSRNKTPWSPKFDTVDGTLGALPPMLGENMDDINRDIGDTVWDTG